MVWDPFCRSGYRDVEMSLSCDSLIQIRSWLRSMVTGQSLWDRDTGMEKKVPTMYMCVCWGGSGEGNRDQNSWFVLASEMGKERCVVYKIYSMEKQNLNDLPISVTWPTARKAVSMSLRRGLSNTLSRYSTVSPPFVSGPSGTCNHLQPWAHVLSTKPSPSSLWVSLQHPD